MNESKIKEQLLKEKVNLEKQLSVYGSEDPYLGSEKTATHNFEDAPIESEEHDRIGATTRDLRAILLEVKRTLEKMDSGKYGVCESCSNKITEERLSVIPTARCCLDCEPKVKK